jgi:hypothetical protein
MRDFPDRGARAAALLILTALSGCDNVQWGGSSMQVVPPPPASDVVQASAVTEGSASLGLPTGSVLFHVVRTANGAQIVPVAEISGDSLRTLRRPAGVSPQAYEQRFRRAVLEPNSQFVLFRRGARVGTATVQGNGPVSTCGVPSSVGPGDDGGRRRRGARVHRLPQGAGAGCGGRVLAAAGSRAHPPLRPADRRARRAAERPSASAKLARRPARPAGAGRGARRAAGDGLHLLVGDQLAVGPPEEDGWSVFFVASYEQRTGYNPFYTEVSDYRKGGKRAPKLVDYLNWNRTGGAEMLVQVFGAQDSWYEAVSQDRGNRWARVWEGTPCRGEAP